MNNQRNWAKDERVDLEKNVVPESVHYEPKRVILLLDIDAFEVQVWMKNQMQFFNSDRPIVVTSPDAKIISENYTAKNMGVKRGEGPRWLEDARALCLQNRKKLLEIPVGQRYGKPDTFTPIVESNRILNAIFSWTKMRETKLPIKIERIYHEDFYLDLTDLIAEKMSFLYEISGNSIGISQKEINVLTRPKEHPCHAYDGAPTTCIQGLTGKIVGEELRCRVQQLHEHDTDELRLVHGALFADSIIQHIKKETQYEVSAGVGHSKMVAKIACGLNKPTGISIIPDIALPRLSKKIQFQHLPGFGRKTGDSLQRWMSSIFGENAIYISDINQGVREGINFGTVLRELGFKNYKKTAEDLLKKCHFQDKSTVTYKVHPDTMSTEFLFKEGGEIDFNEGVWNISKDMEDRIQYYRRIFRRTPKELIVQFTPYTGARTKIGPSNTAPMNLQQDTHHFVSHESIRDYILKSIPRNGLSGNNSWTITLTAKQFTDKDIGGIRSVGVTT